MTIHVVPSSEPMTFIDTDTTLQRRLFTYSVEAMKLAADIDTKILNTPEWIKALTSMDRVFQLARDLSISQGVVLTGPSGSGKSVILSYFLESLPPSTSFEEDMGALALRLQFRPSLGRMVTTLLQAVDYPFPSVDGHTVWRKKDILYTALKKKGTRVLLIDEAQHMCHPSCSQIGVEPGGGNPITAFLKELMDQTHVGLVLAGDKSLSQLLVTDTALSERVRCNEELGDYQPDENWIGFVKSFSSCCTSFNIKYLGATKATTAKLHRATGGNLRRFKSLTIEAVLVAYDTGKREVDEDVLATAFARVHGRVGTQHNPFEARREAAVAA